MNIKEIKELVEILENSALSSLEVSEDGKSIRLEKKISQAPVQEKDIIYVNGPAHAAESPEAQPEAASVSAVSGNHEGTPVDSPMVGVFYRKPSPDEAPYVEVGTQVKKGQTLCIIEAMKLMNEIPAEKDGVVTEICMNDGDLVEFGQTLFYIK